MEPNIDARTNERQRAEKLVLDRLDSLQRAGVMQLPKARASALRRPISEGKSSPAAVNTPLATPMVVPSPTAVAAEVASAPEEHTGGEYSIGWQPLRADSLLDDGSPAMAATSQAGTLEILQQEVVGCTRCAELAHTRTQTVFGVGNPHAQLCFIGEAPGADEDRLGEPFVGRAGQLLTKIIEACRLQRSDVYILNMLKCRPPGNRTPLPDELANCRGFLERQLALIRPPFICCLGAVAAQNLLGTTVSIGRLRGKVHSFRGAKIVCTYHPAYLLRNPAAKKDTWDDMKLLMREMGVEL